MLINYKQQIFLSMKQKDKKNTKKELRTTLHQKLSLALADYKNILQEKKYERSIKKASRRLTTEIIEALNKESKITAKGTKKQA